LLLCITYKTLPFFTLLLNLIDVLRNSAALDFLNIRQNSMLGIGKPETKRLFIHKKEKSPCFKKFSNQLTILCSITMLLILTACGSGGGGSSSSSTTPSTDNNTIDSITIQNSTVTGTLQEDTTLVATLINILSVGSVYADIPEMIYLDDENGTVMLDADNNFTISNIQDGDHSLFWEDGDTRYEFEFRMSEARGLDFGTITIKGEKIDRFTGFNGYHFGFVDEDGDGVNDNFADVDGDGICDNGRRFAGYAYMQEYGFADADGDGVNDRFIDADGDGINDVNTRRYGYGFGFVDEYNNETGAQDPDGLNDRFTDTDGDGICDVSGIPFGHGFGFADENNDGINDRFIDANGDGVNDRTGEAYVAMPGWVDVDNDGVNDYFSDQNGDGINDRFVDNDNDGVNDLAPLGFAHGFGYIDADGDGINDRFTDADGDGINDLAQNRTYRYGYMGDHVDVEGDGIDDVTLRPYRQCFGWVDSDNNGTNDVFTDANSDGFNDVTNYSYNGGFVMGPGGTTAPMWDGESRWPRGSMRGGMMGGGMMR